ncbi:response regulator [Lusitaniella coriacea LEGE 07157]|uniref:Response regulator n=1 Tax=Lusitaniella coriacea LEGE 07157 TaxID=945747 RepID=A0A8J7DLG9_9CYAN|nr:response regulator [Lusitaniella coriacea]MBE9115043.1 response regulator [Lusitaniella coriacea LEGE 07157]
MNILLVEDDLLLAKGTAKLIERMSGYQIQVRTDPAKIVELCQSGKIDLVLMDVNLPGAKWEDRDMSGADISCLLKKHPQTQHIPIILLTAYAMVTERERLLQVSGADEFYTKPITNYAALIESIAQLCPKTS